MRHFKAIVGAMLGLVATAVALPAMAADTFKIGIDAAYRPFAYVNEAGELTGFEVDLSRAVCAQMKVECEISNVPWDGIFAALEAGSIEMIGTTTTLSPARMEKHDTSKTIYRMGLAFAVPESTDTSNGLDGLKGKAIGVITGTDANHAYIKGMLGDDADIRDYTSADAAALDLNTGRIAAFVADNFQLQGQFINSGKYKFAAEPNYESKWTGQGRGWIFRKGSGEIVGKINAALDALAADGTIDKLSIKYFNMPLKAK
ncbi:MAG: hypothetical protein ABS35_27100 [Kaistia sp. SCN 65-12]|nr:MAG: hypothetical protein ABS35_27100 [Kaistia sp. SCN 65-12]